MTRQVLQLRRGSQSDISTFTGAIGEVTYDTTRKTLVVHDGTTVGGSALATLASPAFTGTPTAPTPSSSDNSTKIATTAYVNTVLSTITYPSVTTSSVTEGSNLYFTNARARAAFSVSGALTYNSSTGVFGYVAPTALSQFTNDVGFTTGASLRGQLSATGDISYNQSTGVISYSESVQSVNNQVGTVTLTTDNITEGTSNFYYTPARVRSAVSGGTGVTVNSSTGVISLTNTSVLVNGQTLSLLTSGSVTLTTDNIGQGSTNLYFSNALARGALSSGAGLAYNSTTGAFSIDSTQTTTLGSMTVDTTTLVVSNVTHRVGILNNNPGYSLDVSGDINFTGSLRVSGSPGTAGYVLSSGGTGSGASWANLNTVLPNVTELDSLASKFDGGTFTFSPTNNGSAVTITAPIQLLATLNGVILTPYINTSNIIWQSFPGGGALKQGDYTIDSNGNIVFASPPQPTDKFTGRVLVGNASNTINSTYPYRAIDIATGI
jgi:Major tropism determinant N-terminal domain